MINAKSFFRLWFVLLILFLVHSSVLAGGYNLAGVGAKALTMSGAFRGVADDWSAMYWNPAGLAGQSNAVALEGKSLFPLVWLTPNVTSHYSGYEGYVNGVEVTTNEQAYPAGAFGVTLGLPNNLTAGFSVFAPSALGAEWKGLYTGPPYGYHNDDYPDIAWSSDLKVFDIHPSIAYQVNEDLKLGLGIGINMGIIKLQVPKKIPTKAIMPSEHFYADAVLEGDGIGFGFNLGALYKVNEKLSIGVAYRHSVTIPITGTLKQTVYLPNSPGLQSAKPELAHLFEGGTAEAEPDGEADFPLPRDAGIGLAYHPNAKLTLTYDVVWTNWGAVDEIDIVLTGDGPVDSDGDGVVEPAEDTKLLLMYADTYRVSIGADYLFYEPKNMYLRFGYYFDPSPIPAGSLRPTITDVADKHNFSVGFKYMAMEDLAIEAYWEHLFTNERSVVSLDANEDGSIDNIAGDWKLQVDTFGIQATYFFKDLFGGGE